MYHNYYTLITGAGEGFGKALALECAGRKMNILLVALPGSELYNLQDFIRRNYDVQVIAIGKDLSEPENCFAMFKEVVALDIKINMLINNAGLGSTVLFSEASIQLFQTQIKLNILATTLITKLFVEHMDCNSPSHILNVGSLGSYFFIGKKQVYSATKSYIYSFSKSLRIELQSKNINVSVVCPGCMPTNILNTLQLKSSGRLAQLSAMNPEQVAPIAIDGLLKRKAVIIPGFINNIFLLLNNIVPDFIINMITQWQMKSINAKNLNTKSSVPPLQYSNTTPHYSLNLK